MKKIKLYQWKGVGSLSLLLELDGKKKEIEFPTGTEKPRVNARYETSDEVIQGKIEATGLFKTGQIKLVSEKTIAEPAVSAPADTPEKPKTNGGSKGGQNAKKEAPKANPNEFTAVTSYQQAGEILTAKFGVAADQLTDPETIMAKASELGATFPNLID